MEWLTPVLRGAVRILIGIFALCLLAGMIFGLVALGTWLNQFVDMNLLAGFIIVGSIALTIAYKVGSFFYDW